MEGKVKVIIEFTKDFEIYVESYWVKAWAIVESTYDEGYSDRAGSYHDVYSDITIDEEMLEQLVFEEYGDIDYIYEIDEDSFE